MTLSKRFGTVLAACIGDQGGSYILDVYRDGQLVRSLNNEAPARGTPLPEEKGIDVTDFTDEHVLEILESLRPQRLLRRRPAVPGARAGVRPPRHGASAAGPPPALPRRPPCVTSRLQLAAHPRDWVRFVLVPIV